MRRENFLFWLGIIFIGGNLASNKGLEVLSEDLSELFTLITILILTATLLLIRALHKKEKTRISLQGCYILIFFLLGSFFLSINEIFKPKISDSILIENSKQKISGIINEVAKTQKGLSKLEVNLGKENIILYILKSSYEVSIETGDSITGVITPNRISNFSNTFDYVSYMSDQNIFYSTFIRHQGMIITPCDSPSIPHKIERLRNRFDKYLASIITFSDSHNEDVYSILKALTIGDKSNIGSSLKESFQKSGTMHLLALSGLHVGIIYKLLTYILSILGNFPKIKKSRSIIIIIILCIYAGFTGFSTSILRAVLMASIYEISSLLGRDKSQLNTLALSAIIISIIDPRAPSEIGFQLSFSAMLGIFTFYPTLRNILPQKIHYIRPLWDTICISISCQIFTSPLVYYYFQTFPYFSLFTNLLALPLTSIIMTLTPIFLIFPSIPYLGETLIFIVNLLIEIISIGKEVSDW